MTKLKNLQHLYFKSDEDDRIIYIRKFNGNVEGINFIQGLIEDNEDFLYNEDIDDDLTKYVLNLQELWILDNDDYDFDILNGIIWRWLEKKLDIEG